MDADEGRSLDFRVYQVCLNAALRERVDILDEISYSLYPQSPDDIRHICPACWLPPVISTLYKTLHTSTWKWHISPECLRTESDHVLNVSVGMCRSGRTFFPPPSPVLLSVGVVEAGLPPSSCRCVRLQITMAGEHTLFDLHIIS